MIITRDTTTYRNLQANLSSTSTTINQLYIKTATGIEVDKASENPSSVGTILSCRSDIVKGERYVENCKNVQDNLSTSEIYINSLEDLMERAKEIAITGANDSLSDSDKQPWPMKSVSYRKSCLTWPMPRWTANICLQATTIKPCPFRLSRGLQRHQRPHHDRNQPRFNRGQKHHR